MLLDRHIKTFLKHISKISNNNIFVEKCTYIDICVNKNMLDVKVCKKIEKTINKIYNGKILLSDITDDNNILNNNLKLFKDDIYYLHLLISLIYTFSHINDVKISTDIYVNVYEKLYYHVIMDNNIKDLIYKLTQKTYYYNSLENNLWENEYNSDDESISSEISVIFPCLEMKGVILSYDIFIILCKSFIIFKDFKNVSYKIKSLICIVLFNIKKTKQFMKVFKIINTI